MCVYAARKGDYEDSLRMRRGKDYLLGVILQDYLFGDSFVAITWSYHYASSANR